VVPGWGFLLNNEVTDFNFDSQTHPNKVEGAKRPRSFMSPTIVLDDGRPLLALGSPGGSMIITTVLQRPRGPARPRRVASAGDRGAAGEPAQHGGDGGRARVRQLDGGKVPRRRLRTHVLHDERSEIGAVAAIEFLGRGRVLAAAEPQRRGGGSGDRRAARVTIKDCR
jgi:gamma-glutamyltranspeptidase / glutathione hydrolase